MAQVEIKDLTVDAAPAATDVVAKQSAAGGVGSTKKTGLAVLVASFAPKAHAASHTDGSDDIQDATAGQKGLATAAQITKLDGIEPSAEVNDVTTVHARVGAVVSAASDYDASQVDNDSNVPGAFVDDALNSAELPKDFDDAESAGRSTTTSATFQNKATLVTGALTGTYRFFGTAAVDNGGALGEVRLFNVTDAARIGALHIHKAGDAAERKTVFFSGKIVLAGVTKTIALQFRDQAGGNTQGITDARIEMERVA